MSPSVRDAELVTQQIDGRRSGRFLKERIQVPIAHGAVTLTRKRPADRTLTKGAVLLIHGFGQNRYTWHLSQRSFANYLAAEGFDVFNLELRGHGHSRTMGSLYPKTFESYVEEDVVEAVRVATEISGHARLFLVGHSLGGAISYAAAPLIPERIAGVITLGGVFMFGGQPLLRMMARSYGLAARIADPILVRALPFIPVDLIGRVIAAAAPVLDHRTMRRWPLALWYPGSMESPVLQERMRIGMDRTGFGVLRQMIGWAAEGHFVGRQGGRDYAQAFRALDVPLLVISASRDMLCTPDDCYPAYLTSRSQDRTYRKFGSRETGHWGHVDLICGRRAPELVWPYILDWLQSRCATPSIPERKGADSMLNEGDPFPDFTLPGDDGNPVSTSDFRGQKVVLYIYPKDSTPGCTTESCDFRDHYKQIRKQGAVVLGLSKDKVAGKQKFKAKYDLPFPLLADEDKSVLDALGVWKEKNMYGKKVMGIERTTFLIDEAGIIQKVWRKVKVPGHVDEVLATL